MCERLPELQETLAQDDGCDPSSVLEKFATEWFPESSMLAKVRASVLRAIIVSVHKIVFFFLTFRYDIVKGSSNLPPTRK